MRRLIVSADDFGLCAGAVDGPVHAHRRGIVTSVSVMVTTPSLPSALEALRACPGLDVGVHLDFTEGCPALPPSRVPGLVDARGRFLPPRAWLSTDPGMDATRMNELADEMRAQIALVQRGSARVSHLDLHLAVGYLVPEIFALTVTLAKERGLAMRFPFGGGWERKAEAMAGATGMSTARLHETAARYQGLVAEGRVPHPDRLIEAFPDAASCNGEALLTLLRNLGEGTSEMLTHPSFQKGCRGCLGAASRKRAAELAALCEPQVRQAVQEEGIELVGFDSLADAPHALR